jgi:hypothetical protein
MGESQFQPVWPSINPHLQFLALAAQNSAAEGAMTAARIALRITF